MPLEPHPLATRYPPMKDADYEAFKADIEANGLKNPIVRYDGKILDGLHRYRACRELHIPPVFEDFRGTEDEARLFVRSQNLHRRHLTAEFRRELAVEMRAEGMSLRKIAAELGVDEGTVRNDIKRAGAEYSAPAPHTQTEGGQVGTDDGESARQDRGRSEAADDTRRGDDADHDADCERAGDAARPASVPVRREKPDAQPARPAPARPERVIGRDGKSHPATKPKKTPAKPTACSKGVGVARAQDAINCLKLIPVDDPLREEARAIVQKFLDINFA